MKTEFFYQASERRQQEIGMKREKIREMNNFLKAFARVQKLLPDKAQKIVDAVLMQSDHWF